MSESGFWTPTKETKLRQLLDAKASYTEMAAVLHCTKGAVSGKLTRLHLTNKNYSLPDRRKGMNNNPQGRNGNGSKHFALKDKATPGLPKSLALMVPRQHAQSCGRIWQPSNGGEGVGFTELPQGACLWPLAEPSRRWPPQWRTGSAGMICCAAHCEPDRPYCAMHARVSVGQYELEGARS